MNYRYLHAAWPVLAAALLTGCIDDNYDLSDIDTSVRVPVNDLVVPVNVGDIALNSIIDIEDSENIVKEEYNGPIAELQGKKIFVFRQKGNFTSDPISINSFHVDAPDDLEPTKIDVYLNTGMPEMRPAKRGGATAPGAGVYEYDIKDVATSFSYHIKDVDAKVQSVEQVETPKIQFSTTISIDEAFRRDMQSMSVENMTIAFPKGLTMKSGKPAQSTLGTYDNTTGIVTIGEAEIPGNSLSLTLTAEVIDTKLAGVTLSNGHFDYDGSIDVLGGKLYLTPKNNVIPPNYFQLTANYNLSSFDIENFTGRIDYDIEDLNFDDVTLNDLPDFLSQEGTAIRIANPQIYLSITNSCAAYGLEGETGLTITPVRKDGDSTPLPMNEKIKVGTNKGSGPYLYAISPEGDALNPIAGYQTAEKLMFSELPNILYGNGLPDALKIEFDDPQVLGMAKKFPLKLPGAPEADWKIESVKGDYEFRAPLALDNGSVIGYSGTEGDWDSEALEDLHIEMLELTTSVSTDIPLAVNFSAELIDADGKYIGKCDSTVIEANAKDQEVTITITPNEGMQDLTGINGVYYKVEAIAPSYGDNSNPSDVPALSPEQTITLKDVRAKIRGYYEHLDKDDDK